MEVVNSLSNTSSRLAKEEILAEVRDNELVKKVFRLAYDPAVRFHFIPRAWFSGDASMTLDEALDSIIHNLSSRLVTGNAASKLVDTLYSSLSNEDAAILFRVMTKDLCCGVSLGTIQRIWPGLISVPKFMLADTDPSKIVYPAISQTKIDGARAKLVWDGTSVVFMTRSGKIVETGDTFVESMKACYPWINWSTAGSIVLDGELVATRDGLALPRKEGNGIINKALQNKASEAELNMLIFVAWDLEHAPNDPYEDRFATLEACINYGHKRITSCRIYPVDSRVVDSYEEALSHFKAIRSAGGEGTILKNMNAVWQPKRTKDCVKFKAEVEGDFEVIGFDYGTGKHAKRVGALHIRTACGAVECKVGIFKDMDESVRDDLLTNMPKVVTVLYNERISQKGRDTESLFLPRIISLRYDKDTANTKEELVAIEQATLKD